MVAKRDLTEEIDQLVDHIESNANDEWLVLTYRDIARIVGTTPGSSTTKRLMEELKQRENVVYSLLFDPSKGKRPLQFRIVNSEEKQNQLDEKRYSKLTEDEIELIKQTIGHDDVSDITELLAVVNYAKTQSLTQETFIFKSDEYLSKLLGIYPEDFSDIVSFLIAKGLLIDEDGRFKLNLNHQAIYSPRNENKSSVYDYFSQAHNAQKELVDFIEREILPQVEAAKESDEKLREGHETMSRLLVTYEKEHHELEALKAENKKLKAQLDKALMHKHDISDHLQDALQVFLWKVQQIALEDSRKMIAIKNTNAYRARLARDFTQAGEELYEQVIELSKT